MPLTCIGPHLEPLPTCVVTVGALSTLKLISLISVKTCTVLIDAVALPLPKLIDAFPAVDVFSLSVKFSLVSTKYCSLPTVDTFAAPVLGKIP
jgi:hypothetical protein